jgi:tyrosyl-tRNA synthetase
LYKDYNCVLQIGGSDQWGNIVNGVELIRRMLQKESYGLTTPLITLASGTKMGKTEKGAIWLNEDLLSPYDYWQFWRNIDDRDVERFLNFFTEINTNEIKNIVEKEKNINNLKILLANEATKILHGEVSARKAEQTAKETFEEGGIGLNLPEIRIKLDKINQGISLLDLLSINKITSSKSEARRAIGNKGIKLDNKIVNDENKIIQISNFKNKILKISYGKKKHYLVKII